MLSQEKKLNILWVTADCFADHDICVVPQLSDVFNIHWIIMFPSGTHRFCESDFENLLKKNRDLKISFIHTSYRKRYPQNIFFYDKIERIAQKEMPDIVHLDFGVDDPWSIPLIYKLSSKKTIIVAHQGKPHEGMNNKWICSLVRKIIFKKIKHVKMFSDSQATIFSNIFPKINVYRFRLPLIDFGNPTINRSMKGQVKFLSFGSINYAKNIDLLIDAACLLYERGIRGFKVSINGICKDWGWYERRIKYPELFDNHIRMIDNKEIPNLFNCSHYLVQPYRVVSQSGPTKIAYNYNLPVIVSDLPGFTDEVVEGVNGFCFKCGDVNSLADKMEYLIKLHDERYESLLDKMKIYTQENYSPYVWIQQYTNVFNKILDNR